MSASSARTPVPTALAAAHWLARCLGPLVLVVVAWPVALLFANCLANSPSSATGSSSG